MTQNIDATTVEGQFKLAQAVKQGRVLRVLNLMVEEGLTQREACARVEISEQTLRSYLTDNDLQIELAAVTSRTLKETLIAALELSPEIVNRLGQIMQKGSDEAAIKAAHELRVYLLNLIDRLQEVLRETPPSPPTAPPPAISETKPAETQAKGGNTADEDEGEVAIWKPTIKVQITPPMIVEGKAMEAKEGETP